MNRTSSFAIAALLALTAAGCVPDPTDDTVSPVVQTGLDATFVAAGAEFDVPPALLSAIGYVESRWQMVEGTAEFDGAVGKIGVMGLRTDDLATAAARVGADAEDLRNDAATNVRAAAAQLAALATARGIDRGSLEAWRPVVAEFAHIDDAEARDRYVDDDVYGTLATGAVAYAESGELIARLAPQKVAVVPLVRDKAAGPDYASAVWRSSPNYSARPSGTPIWMVVIHTCEGNYAGCWGWLRNTAAQASAHYVVNESGSEISQLVRESSRAWHVAASYVCARNGNYNCGKNGQSVNNFSVGIEHAGFASQSTFPNGQIEASARLTCDITRDHAIPRDRNHIVGHGQLQPSNRVDPGPNWPWSHYIDRVRTLCGDNGGGGGGGGGGGAIIVDSNNANNDAAVARIELTGTWTSASSTPGYYGSGYWFADTAATTAPATFWFYLGAAGSHAVDAWWTAGPNRASAAPFIAYNAAGTEVGRVTKDQRASGGTWSSLGTWGFTKGWNKIVLSRWTSSGAVVIADAVRIR